MCFGSAPSAPAPAPPPPPPAPAAPAPIMASASSEPNSDVSKLARLKGRGSLRIDQTAGSTQNSGAAGGLNIPN